MIIKGNPAGSVKYWSRHLLRDDTNSRVEVVEISGLLAEDLPSALMEMEAIADQSRCHGNFMYQASINPRDHEHLTPEQWREAVDMLEKNLGLEGHQRIVIEHEKEGRVHRHVVWNRVDVDTLRVADVGGNYYTHERTGREIEKRFGLEPTRSLHGEHREEGRPERTPELWEQRASSRSHIDPKEMKAELSELWRSTDSGKAFVSAIEERGYILAKGDRRDFCVVDHAGDAHSLARRIDGARAQDIRERMADVDRASLPSVDEARDVQHERFPDGASIIQAWEQGRDRQADPIEIAEPHPTASRPETEREATDDQRFDGWSEREINAHDRWEQWAEDEHARVDEITVDAGEVTRPALFVTDAAGKLAMTVLDFVCGFLDSSPPRQRDQTNNSNVDELLANRRAAAAMERMRESMERGEGLQAADLLHLPATQLENIRARGDDYLRELIDDMRRDEERRNDYGRSRER